jgi:hypothetical protein
MSKERENGDQDLKDVMTTERRRVRSNRPTDPAKDRRFKDFAAGFLKVIQAKDARALTELLKRYEIPEGSEEWKRAWKIFYES